MLLPPLDSPIVSKIMRWLATRCPLWVVSGHCPASASCLLYPRKQTSALPHKRMKTEARGKRRGVALYGDITADRACRLRFDKLPSLTSSPVNFEGVFVGQAETLDSDNGARLSAVIRALRGVAPASSSRRSPKRFPRLWRPWNPGSASLSAVPPSSPVNFSQSCGAPVSSGISCARWTTVALRFRLRAP